MLLQNTKLGVKTGFIFFALKTSKYLGNFMKNLSLSPINVSYKLSKFKSPQSYITATLGATSKRSFLE